MKRILKFVKNIDLFGENVCIYINDSPTYKTLIGGFLSFITILTTLIITALNLNSFLNNRPINTYIQTRILSNYSPIEITNQTYKSAFHLVKYDKGMEVFSNYSFEDIDARNYVTTATSNSNSTFFNFLNCSQTDFVPYTSEFSSIKNNPLLKIYKYMLGMSNCIVLDSGKHYLGGDMIYSNNYTDFKINFTLNLCPYGCDEEYYNYISKLLFFNLFLLDAYPDMTIPEGFQQYVYYYIIQNFDFTKDYLYTVTYQKNLIYTENGILYNTGYQLNQFLTVKDVTVSTFRRTLMNKKSNVYIKILLDRKENVYYRSYMKLDLLIANISAYSTIFYNIFLFICNFLNHKKLSLKLINKFFNSPSDWNKGKKFDTNDLITKKIRIVKYKPQQESVSKFRDEVSESFRDKIVKYVERKRTNKIRLFSPLYGCCHSKNKKFEYGEKLLNYHIDINYIIKRLSDLENLKALLLDKHH
jgi:hypothetical protein